MRVMMVEKNLLQVAKIANPFGIKKFRILGSLSLWYKKWQPWNR
jgi:hypothetical protein